MESTSEPASARGLGQMDLTISGWLTCSEVDIFLVVVFLCCSINNSLGLKIYAVRFFKKKDFSFSYAPSRREGVPAQKMLMPSLRNAPFREHFSKCLCRADARHTEADARHTDVYCIAPLRGASQKIARSENGTFLRCGVYLTGPLRGPCPKN